MYHDQVWGPGLKTLKVQRLMEENSKFLKLKFLNVSDSRTRFKGVGFNITVKFGSNDVIFFSYRVPRKSYQKFVQE